MIENKDRIGNFTSSQIYNLCAVNKDGSHSSAYYTYIGKKIRERKMKRSLDMGKYGASMAWGRFLEKRVNDNLPLNYQMLHKSTMVHPKFNYVAGSVDFLVPNIKVSELKCYEPDKFSAYVSALMTCDLEHIKKEFAQEYWQCLSNSQIHKTPKMEFIAYMPYESEMEDIRELAEDPEYLSAIGMMPWEVRFITEKPNSQLAVLPNDSEFKNLNVFEFDVPINDVIFLNKNIISAGKILLGK
jgi:hypothetical protein